MLGLLLVALAMASPTALSLFILPGLLAVIITCWVFVGHSPIQGMANPHTDDELVNTARSFAELIKPVSYEDLFMAELSALDSTLSDFFLTIGKLTAIEAAVADMRIAHAADGYDRDEEFLMLLPRDQRYDGHHEITTPCFLKSKILCYMMLLTLYLLFSAGLWRLLVASLRASLISVSQPCLLFCAPARSNGIAVGCVSMFLLGAIAASQKPDGNGMILLPTITCVGAWVGSIAKALCFATMEVALAHIRDPNEFNFSHPDFEQLFWCQLLPPGQHLLSPHQCRFSQDSISARFRDGHEIAERRRIQQYTISACFHEGELFTLNNRTLYSAIIHNIWPIRVTIVEKPTTWSSRFTALSPWTSIRVRRRQLHPFDMIEQASVLEAGIVGHAAHADALVIPADAFPGNTHQAEGHVVLEVNNIINSRQPQAETLVMILRTRCPGFIVEEVEGDRSFARARIRIADEAVIRAVIKSVGRERRKRVTISEVRGSRVFLSPRD